MPGRSIRLFKLGSFNKGTAVSGPEEGKWMTDNFVKEICFIWTLSINSFFSCPIYHHVQPPCRFSLHFYCFILFRLHQGVIILDICTARQNIRLWPSRRGLICDSKEFIASCPSLRSLLNSKSRVQNSINISFRSSSLITTFPNSRDELISLTLLIGTGLREGKFEQPCAKNGLKSVPVYTLKPSAKYYRSRHIS